MTPEGEGTMHIVNYIPFGRLLPAVGLVLLITACHRPGPSQLEVVLPFADVDSAQVDSVLEVLTLEEKIGQLIVWTPDLSDTSIRNNVYRQVAKGRVGGLILEKVGLADYLFMADSCKRLSALPVFFGSNQKVSLHNQFLDLPKFPYPATMAAIDSSALHRMLEGHFWQQCKALGINFVLGPTLKLDDPRQPAFDFQTFESQASANLERALWSFQSLKNRRIVTIGDRLTELPFVQNDTLRDSILQRYQLVSRLGMGGLVVDDRVFLQDSMMNRPGRYLKNYLQEHLDFNGLTVVRLDPLESPGYKFFQGADLFVTSEGQKAFYSFIKMVERGRLSEKELDKKVRNILMAKAWSNGGRLPVLFSEPLPEAEGKQARLVSLEDERPVTLSPDISVFTQARADELLCYFQDPNWSQFIHTLYGRSIIVASDQTSTLPFRNIYDVNFQVFEYSNHPFKVFKSYFIKYADCKTNKVSLVSSGTLKPVKFDKPIPNQTAIVLLDSIELQLDYHEPFINSINNLGKTNRVVLVNFGNPKNLVHFDSTVTSLQVFERNESTEAYTAQLLFGGVAGTGRLPIALPGNLTYGAGLALKKVRLGYASPENVGIAAERLVGIDAIAETAVDKGVFPGCQVVMAKDGQVIFSKAFGHHTYSEKRPVQKTDLFDIASVTKIAATTLAVMKLQEAGKIALKNNVEDYLNLDSAATIGKLTIKELLLHQSGLQAQMPIARYISWRNVPPGNCNDYFCRKKQGDFSIPVAGNLFLRKNYVDSIWHRVYHLPVSSRKYYRYSDVNFFLLEKIVETIASKGLDEYISDQFYRPLGLRYTGYKPLQWANKNTILPTENDRIWRKTLVQGYVHDPSAALMGGVGGNAGVFATAEDLAALFQMLLDGGNYGGESFLGAETIHEYTASNRSSHRGLGFDKPVKRKYPTYSHQASPKSFGHTGFTGTCVWVDPENNTVYIFLSNRINPNVRNGKIFTESIRNRIHDILYDAIGTYQLSLPLLNSDGVHSNGN